MMSMKKQNNNGLKPQWGTLLGSAYSDLQIVLFIWRFEESDLIILHRKCLWTKQDNDLGENFSMCWWWTGITGFLWYCLLSGHCDTVIWKVWPSVHLILMEVVCTASSFFFIFFLFLSFFLILVSFFIFTYSTQKYEHNATFCSHSRVKVETFLCTQKIYFSQFSFSNF